MRTPIGFMLLIVIPASLIIIIEIRNIVKELKKQKREQTGKEPRRMEIRGKGNLIFCGKDENYFCFLASSYIIFAHISYLKNVYIQIESLKWIWEHLREKAQRTTD